MIACQLDSQLDAVQEMDLNFIKRLKNRQQIRFVMAEVSKYLETIVGKNLLVRLGTDIHLCKLEKYECLVGYRAPSVSWLEYVDSPAIHRKARSSWDIYQVLLEGPHLSFRWDEEFNIYLPQSREQGIIFTLAAENLDKKIDDFRSRISFVDGEAIPNYLQMYGVHPAYVEGIVTPFLFGKHTDCRLGEPTQGLVDYPFNEITERAGEQGSFFYVGGESEVYMWGIVRCLDGHVDFGGAWTASTHPVLFFSNGYLNGIPTNSLFRLGSSSVTAFDDRPFIFPAAGREQEHQHHIFNQRYTVLTCSFWEAMAHFASTPFARYYDPHIVEQYYKRVTDSASS